MGDIIKINEVLILFIAAVFLLSVSASFAADENLNQTISETDDNVIAVDNNLQAVESVEQQAVESGNDDVVMAEIKDSDVLNDNIQTIKMNGVVKRYNGYIQYKATFLDESGNPIKNQKVIFEVDDYNDYAPITDSNGIALLTIPISNGNHKIAALNPVSLNISNDNIKVFNVVSGGKNINMYYDNGNVYKVRVFDDNGNPVKAGQKVTFKINGKKYVKKTDKKGYASLKITQTPGLYEISATYKDFTIYNTVNVKSVVKAKTGKVKIKKTLNFKVTFLGKNKKNKVLKVKFNKKTYKAKTNKKGVAVFKLISPKKVGKYKVVVMYKKSKVNYIYTKYS